MCKCLGIHHSIYYYHCNHTTNSYKIANQKLDVEIKKIYDESKGRYGSPKITKVLKSRNINVSPNTTNVELQKTFPIVLARMKKLKEQNEPVLTKKLTLPKDTENK